MNYSSYVTSDLCDSGHERRTGNMGQEETVFSAAFARNDSGKSRKAYLCRVNFFSNFTAPRAI